MMEPNFSICDVEKRIVLELCEKADEIDLGNVSFDDYRRRLKFEMTLDNNGWSLYVSDFDNKLDIYGIINAELVYRYSE